MKSKSFFIQVEATAKFQRNLRILARKYSRIRKDVEPIIEQLQLGELPGEQVPGVKYAIFQLSIKNDDIQEQKNKVYRIIYYVKTFSNIILVTIY